MRWVFFCLCLLLPGLAAAAELEIVALFKDRAVVRSQAGERLLRVGETSPEGVTLLAADAHGARIRVGQREQVLGLSTRVAGSFTTPAPTRVQIDPDPLGQYRVRGTINGRTAELLVDTGASVVVMSERHARALGVNFQNAPTGLVTTAQGTIEGHFPQLDRVAVAGIEVSNVAAAVLAGDYPVEILLGMSFLRDLVLETRAGILTLTQQP